MNGVGSNNVGDMPMASKRPLKLHFIGASVMYGGSQFHGPLSAGQDEHVLDRSEVVPLEVISR